MPMEAKLDQKKTVATTVKKGSKINKLAATPKRSGYTFKGFFTKKSGGTKISKNTKPSKSLTYYAQWKKGTSSVLTAEEKKLVGKWYRYVYYSTYNTRLDQCIFYDNGKFDYIVGDLEIKKGNYKVSGGKISYTNVVTTFKGGNTEKFPDTVVNYKFEKNSQSKSDNLHMPQLQTTMYETFGIWYKSEV